MVRVYNLLDACGLVESTSLYPFPPFSFIFSLLFSLSFYFFLPPLSFDLKDASILSQRVQSRPKNFILGRQLLTGTLVFATFVCSEYRLITEAGYSLAVA